MRRPLILATTLLASAPLLVGPPPSQAAEPESPAIAMTWEGIALSTVFPATPAAIAPAYLAYTSRAMHQAARTSLHADGSSETAAVAQAAHDVLVHYFPDAGGTLDTRLTESLAGVPDGAGQDLGVAIGAEAADELIADRADDGLNDTSIVYTKPDGIGVWQPDGRGFVGVWLGFMDRFVGGHPVPVDGPDPVGTHGLPRRPRGGPDYRAPRRGRRQGGDRELLRSEQHDRHLPTGLVHLPQHPSRDPAGDHRADPRHRRRAGRGGPAGVAAEVQDRVLASDRGDPAGRRRPPHDRGSVMDAGAGDTAVP